MADDIEMTRGGLMLRWGLFIKWGWKIGEVLLFLLLGGHMYMTRASQDRQDRRMDRIERAIEKCLPK